MKVKNLFGIAALLFVAAMTSCSNDDVVETNSRDTDNDEQVVIPFSATIEKAESTRALAEPDGTGVTAYWKEGEVVAIVTKDANPTELGTATVETVENDGTAIISGTLSGAKDQQEVQLIYPASAVENGKIKSDLLEKQPGILRGEGSIEKLYDVATADSKLSLKDGTATLAKKAKFENLYTICKFQFTFNGEPIESISKLTISGEDGNAITTAELAAPADYVYIIMAPTTEKTTFQFEVTAGSDIYTGTAYATIKQGVYYQLTLMLEKEIDERIVDLGLSVKWASMNIGATKETEYGDYFAWGDIIGHSDDSYSFEIGNAPYYKTDLRAYEKYTADDGKTTLQSEDDAARASNEWGKPWRMPTIDEMQELLDNTTHKYVSDYNGSGVDGMEFTSTVEGFTDKKIFLPDASYRNYQALIPAGGFYWSSSLNASAPLNGQYLYFNSGGGANINIGYGRFYGFSVRPVQ